MGSFLSLLPSSSVPACQWVSEWVYAYTNRQQHGNGINFWSVQCNVFLLTESECERKHKIGIPFPIAPAPSRRWWWVAKSNHLVFQGPITLIIESRWRDKVILVFIHHQTNQFFGPTIPFQGDFSTFSAFFPLRIASASFLPSSSSSVAACYFCEWTPCPLLRQQYNGPGVQ